MHKLHMIIAKHKVASFILWSVFLCGAYTWLLWEFSAPWPAIVIVNLVFLFMTHTWAEYSPLAAMGPAAKELSKNCDPYPLMEVTEELLEYKSSVMIEQVTIINRAVAYRNVGEYQKNLDILKSINIDKASGMLPIYKAVYYNNLMDACFALELNEEACIWYDKMMQIYADIKNKKQMEMMAYVVPCAKATKYYSEKEYEKALSVLEDAVPKDKENEVNSALLHGRIAQAMGEMETAKAKFGFVIDNGNRLYAVEEAKILLKGLEQ